MIIKILGTGCSNCKRLEANAKTAVGEIGTDIDVVKVEDIKDIMGYGIMKTPAIVINEKVKAYGRVSTVEEIKKYICEEK